MNRKLIVGISAEGSVNLLAGQMRYFKEAGYDTYLISPWSDRAQSFCEREGCEHIIVPIKRDISILHDLWHLWKLLMIFSRIKPDIINLGTPKVSLLGMIAGKILGIEKRIYTCRGFRFEHEAGLKRKVLVAMEKLTSLFAHQVICISPSVRQLGLDLDIFKEQKTVVIHKGSSNGVDLSLFDPAKIDGRTKAALMSQLKADDNTFIYGFVGRIVDRKGIREIYESFSTVFANDKSVRLLLVGPIEATQISDPRLMAKISEHPGVIEAGRVAQEEIPLYLSLMDVFVLPAWWEGFGNVLVQAAAMGIPVIATDATGSKDAVVDKVTAELVPIKDVEALTSAMLRLKDNKELRESYGQAGIEWSKNFNSQIIWEGMDKLYKGESVH
jgi:glycosyltransferase involved in cell wall biosynthesis